MTTPDALAARHGPRACDAAHVERVLRRSLPMATMHDALHKAMAGAGVARADF